MACAPAPDKLAIILQRVDPQRTVRAHPHDDLVAVLEGAELLEALVDLERGAVQAGKAEKEITAEAVQADVSGIGAREK